MNVLDLVEKEQLRTDIPAFKPGDTEVAQLEFMRQ